MTADVYEEMRTTPKGKIYIRQEHVTAQAYIEFLSRTDLGQQYPKERFRKRIEKLVNNTKISLKARYESGRIVGNCFGLTDYAYWLLLTDLDIDRAFVKKWHRSQTG